MKEKLIEILAIQSESYNQWRMFAYLIRQLYAMPSSVDFYVHEGNIYITKGKADLYPCVVAHMDTVHNIAEDLCVVTHDDLMTGFNRVTMKQTGVGGDDKVGIFIALQMLERYDNMKVVFFRDEEVGCVGSDLADMEFFSNVSLVLQCDRRGNSDFVVNASGTKMASKAFTKEVGPILKDHKYSIQSGMMTDVMALKEGGLKVSAANISCGYYRPHQADEYVDFRDVMKAHDLVCAIINKMGGTKWEHLPEPKSYGKPYYKKDYTGRWYDWNDWDYPVKKTHPVRYWDSKAQSFVDKPPTNWVPDSKVDEAFKDFAPFENDETNDIMFDQCEACLETSVTKYDWSMNAYLCEKCQHDFQTYNQQ